MVGASAGLGTAAVGLKQTSWPAPNNSANLHAAPILASLKNKSARQSVP